MDENENVLRNLIFTLIYKQYNCVSRKNINHKNQKMPFNKKKHTSIHL